MILYNEEQKILDLFRRNIFGEYTFKQIMDKLNKKSYNWTYRAVNKLSKDIIISMKIGNTTVSRLNLDSPAAVTYLSYLDRKEAYEKNIPLIKDIIESISRKTPYFSLLVTGSYAKGTARKGSDLDIVVIVEGERKKKEIKPYIKEVTRISGINADTHIFTKQDFFLMLTADEENFGKEVFRKHLLFYGVEAYYQIIKEAIRNGLQTKI